MRNRLIILFSFLGLILFTGLFIYLGDKYLPVKTHPTKEDSVIIAENWIRNFSSYPVYGKNLELKDSIKMEEGEYQFVFSFQVDNPDYGVYEREIEIQTQGTEILYAVTDGIFDEKEKKFDIYFIVEENNRKKLIAVKRSFSLLVQEEFNREEVLLTLLEGPTTVEEAKGYVTSLDFETEITSFVIKDGIAYVDLFSPVSNDLEIGREQISRTVTQFEDVHDSVVNISSVKKKEPTESFSIEGVPNDFTFNRHLALGSRGEDVKYLQIVLNSDIETLLREDEGVGYVGSESEYYGYLTVEAVGKFQEKYAEEVLEPSDFWRETGYVGDNTIKKLNQLLESNK
ncbi:MAG: GerMN domain-containing protein [Patescibacteria group bacterium]|nr:GerMN domain-containing protein [Patescibacteria group bacterium]